MRAILAIVALHLLIVTPAHARDMGGAFISSGVGNAGIEAATQSVDEIVADPSAVDETEQVADLDFSYDRRRTSRNLSGFVERTREKDTAAADDLQQLFSAQPDIVAQMGGVMRQFGLDPHNLGDVFALWWMSAWLAANGRHDTPSPETFAGVSRQSRLALGTTAGVAEMDHAARQQYADTLMVQAIVLNSALEQARGQNDLMAKLAIAAKRGAMESGLDLNTMVLTEQGFVPREGADASGVVREDAPALAQVDDGSNATLVAIAAALGLGLGGAFWLGKKAG